MVYKVSKKEEVEKPPKKFDFPPQYQKIKVREHQIDEFKVLDWMEIETTI